MILVTGATGHFGNATIQSLLKKGIPGHEIMALVRDENKVVSLKDRGIQIRIGDYDDYNSLKEALQGINKLLLISSNDPGNSLVQQKNVIDAAKESGVQHIVYTGMEIKNPEKSSIPFVSAVHKATADHIIENGFVYTILNNTLYADSMEKFIGEKFLETGIFFPAGDGKIPFVPRSEMAEAAAEVLATSGHGNKNYAIAADTAYSFYEIAEMLSAITGKKVTYLKPDVNTFIEAATKAGVPKEVASFLGAFGAAMANGEFMTQKSDLERLLGRKPMELKEFLKITFGKEA